MLGIDAAVRAMRADTFGRSRQITLGKLIALLEGIEADEDCWVSYDFARFVPTSGHSWRGSYAEFAIGWAEMDWDKRPMLKDFLSHLRGCVGTEFTGWNGGEFMMGTDTPVWVANDGESDNTGVIGVKPITGANKKAYKVVICTEHCEF